MHTVTQETPASVITLTLEQFRPSLVGIYDAGKGLRCIFVCVIGSCKSNQEHATNEFLTDILITAVRSL